eukprot:TRINITY_DN75047_c0_g1_i1.p1 TRINITY_DN75047_c0_g1~~TRINITY_DN75047_c0_g1_i1.p1  ORF type:complete len:230 (-),score=8.72 TRINITY_DN75047_c0_g1_i1:26-691(-)
MLWLGLLLAFPCVSSTVHYANYPCTEVQPHTISVRYDEPFNCSKWDTHTGGSTIDSYYFGTQSTYVPWHVNVTVMGTLTGGYQCYWRMAIYDTDWNLMGYTAEADCETYGVCAAQMMNGNETTEVYLTPGEYWMAGWTWTADNCTLVTNGDEVPTGYNAGPYLNGVTFPFPQHISHDDLNYPPYGTAPLPIWLEYVNDTTWRPHGNNPHHFPPSTPSTIVD